VPISSEGKKQFYLDGLGIRQRMEAARTKEKKKTWLNGKIPIGVALGQKGGGALGRKARDRKGGQLKLRLQKSSKESLQMVIGNGGQAKKTFKTLS